MVEMIKYATTGALLFGTSIPVSVTRLLCVCYHAAHAINFFTALYRMMGAAGPRSFGIITLQCSLHCTVLPDQGMIEDVTA
jgi:hypothetical protein